MFTPISVSLSGPTFSFLLYENSKCRFQQEGFLLGEIVHKETKTITDNDQQQVNISKTIKVNSVMPCPQPYYFHNGAGKVDRNKVKEFLGSQFDKVVAWYKYQYISSFKFTLRDKIIHKQFTNLFEIPPDLFTCCLLIKEVSENGSTHLFTQAFMRCHNDLYDKLPIHIPNLSEPNNTYKNSEPASETFSKILSNLKIDKKTTQGLVIINKIQNALQKHIDTVIENLSESEKYMHELEDEITQLEIIKKLEKKNEEDMEEMDISFDNISPTLEAVKKKSTNELDNNTRSAECSPELPRKNVTRRNNTRSRGRGRGKNPKELKDTRKTSKSQD